ncbi:MAG: glycerol-3-phosphate 1-O-acyltransferase PlsY [Gemmatimonadaceae bacterium]
MHPAVLLVVSYLLGGIPFAYVAGRVTRGIDLRQHGSGNLGATNVYRTLGGKVAVVVLLLDGLKGALPVLLFPHWTSAPRPELWAIAYGVAAILGHTKSPYLGWQGGGKGVATAAGVFFALAWLPMLAALAVFLLAVLLFGYVSLGSLLASVTLPAVIAFTGGLRTPVFAVAVLVAAFVFWTHRANIGRLRRGEESRFGRKAVT